MLVELQPFTRSHVTTGNLVVPFLYTDSQILQFQKLCCSFAFVFVLKLTEARFETLFSIGDSSVLENGCRRRRFGSCGQFIATWVNVTIFATPTFNALATVRRSSVIDALSIRGAWIAGTIVQVIGAKLAGPPSRAFANSLSSNILANAFILTFYILTVVVGIRGRNNTFVAYEFLSSTSPHRRICDGVEIELVSGRQKTSAGSLQTGLALNICGW